jgi:uncharacterized protein YbaA (DUF1428 family)
MTGGSAVLKENKMYVDGMVCAVPTANRGVFRKHAETAAGIFKENGALQVMECWGDDVPEGKLTSFTMAVQRKDDESVVFSWIAWPDKATRDQGMKAAMMIRVFRLRTIPCRSMANV